MDSEISPINRSGTAILDAPDPNDEIAKTRAEIEATRTDMAQTLDAIKDKLNPADLMDQAKDKVTEMAGSLADKAKDTVHTMVEDVSTHAKDAVTGAVTGTVDSAKEAVGSVVHSAQDMVSGVVDTAKGAGTSVIDTIKRNPVPSALAAFGAVWLYMKNRDTGSRASYSYPSTPSNAGGSMIDQARDRGNEIGGRGQEGFNTPIDTVQGTSMGVIDTIQRNPVPAALAAGAVAWLYLKNKDENKVYRSEANELYPASGFGAVESNGSSHRIMDTAKEKVGQAKDAAGNLIDSAKDKASHLTDAARDKASMLTDTAKEKASHLTDKAKEGVGAIGTHAGQISSSVSESFNSSPLPIGMVAVGIGMALGLLVPESERENQWMGATRDRLVEKAHDTASDIAGKVQTVAQETYAVAKTTIQEQAQSQGLMAGEQSASSSEGTEPQQSPPAPMDQMQDAFAVPSEFSGSIHGENAPLDEEI